MHVVCFQFACKNVKTSPLSTRNVTDGAELSLQQACHPRGRWCGTKYPTYNNKRTLIVVL